MPKNSKTNDVLNHLKANGSITSLEAINLYSATRLSAIIYNLRAKGYNIVTNDITTKDKYGHNVTYAKYTLVNNNSTSTNNIDIDNWFKEDKNG